MNKSKDWFARWASIALLAFALQIVGCTAPRPTRVELPIAVLVSVDPAPSTLALDSAEQAEYRRTGQVRWTPKELFENPFGVRHSVEFFPDTRFILVFNAKLRTTPVGTHLAGHVQNDPGSVAVLTHHGDRFRLTIDSPTLGQFSAHPEPRNNYSVREHTGVNTPHGADDFGGLSSHLEYTQEMIAAVTAEAIRLGTEKAENQRASVTMQDQLSTVKAALDRANDDVKANRDLQAALSAEILTIEGELGRPPATTSPEIESISIQIDSARSDAKRWEAQLAPNARPAVNERERTLIKQKLLANDAEIKRLGGLREAATQRLAAENSKRVSTLRAKLADASDRRKLAVAQLEALTQLLRSGPAKVAALTAQLEKLAQRLLAIEPVLRDAPIRQENHQRMRTWLKLEIARQADAAKTTRTSARKVTAVPATPSKGRVVAASMTVWSASSAGSQSSAPAPHGWTIDANCDDAPGEIELAVAVSEKTLATATIKHGAKAAAILLGEIVHGLNLTNAALLNSGISTPGVDTGVYLPARDLMIVPIPDLPYSSSVSEAYSALLPPNPAEGFSGALYTSILAQAPSADIVLVLVDGDTKLQTLRGMALGTPNPHGDSTKNRRVMVVKRAASVADHIYTFAHEIGHTLGGGHSGADGSDTNFQNFARGARIQKPGKVWASLMAVGDCPAGAPPTYSCRRVPYFSNPTLEYPDYGGSRLGNAAQDNAGAMRFIRENVARLHCSRPAPAQAVWLKKGLASQTNSASANASPVMWEGSSIWVLPDADVESRKTYLHEPSTGNSEAFVNVMLHNAQSVDAPGKLEIWQTAANAGLLLSPSWPTDMVKRCEATIDGNDALGTGLTTVAQIPCGSSAAAGTSAQDFTRDNWMVRWSDNGNNLNIPTTKTRVGDLVANQPQMAWRSMRDVNLSLAGTMVVPVLVRNDTNAPRDINVRIQVAPNQFNVAVSDTGLSEVRFPKARCRLSMNAACNAGFFSSYAVDYFTDSLSVLKLSLPPGAEEIITLHFERTAGVPQQNILIRMTEHDVFEGVEVSQPVGGTTFIVRHSPKAANATAGK